MVRSLGISSSERNIGGRRGSMRKVGPPRKIQSEVMVNTTQETKLMKQVASGVEYATVAMEWHVVLSS